MGGLANVLRSSNRDTNSLASMIDCSPFPLATHIKLSVYVHCFLLAWKSETEMVSF